MPNIKWAWNDKFPPLNLWNYPMRFEDTIIKNGTNVSNANTIQEGGSHYKHKAIQPWDYIASNNLGYLEGNVVKYVSRYQDKNGIEDLKKARHYLDKLIEVKSANQ